MSTWFILVASIGYLGLLFGVAYFAEKRESKGKSLIRNPLAYALSLAAYCTAWTFYGSVGRAATQGIEFLAIYLGPTLMAPLWYIILRKIIVISRQQRINSIADFISARYGKSIFLGGLVTIIAIFGVVPYIALQLKAISFSFSLLTEGNPSIVKYLHGDNFYSDKSFYVAVILAFFTILFGTRHLEAMERHEGLVAAIAFESIVKLIAFLSVGLYVVFWLFDGPTDLFSKALQSPEVQSLYGEGAPESLDLWKWLWLLLISMFAIMMLPRQFHVSVVENTHPNHVKRAIWLFPLYLLLINLFVIPIAMGGLMEFPAMNDFSDTYVLRLPISHGHYFLALFVYLGGLSASTSMVIVATIALSIMASNNLVVPLLLKTSVIQESFVKDLSGRLMAIRRLIIIVIMMLAYVYFNWLGQGTPLVSIGLISFIAVAQFAPPILGGLFWQSGNKKGAVAGLIIGFLVWGFTLPFASIIPADHLFMEEGLLGMGILRPYALFGLEGMDHISHAAFWSLLLNAGTYLFVSLYTTPSVIERSQANLFVNIAKYEGNFRESGFWRGKAFLHDIRMLLNRFLGEARTRELLIGFATRNKINLEKAVEANTEMVNYAETLLAGAIGSASARLLIASVVKEESIGVQEVMKAFDETQQLVQYNRAIEQKSRELERASRQLKQANTRLREMDKLKDDFITTVTHELRTPITSIRALSNILRDNEDLEKPRRQEFLKIIIDESERISRLINQVLDLEKMESGHAEWNMAEVDMGEVLSISINSIRQVCTERGIQIIEHIPAYIPPIQGDKDRLVQVAVNLLSNAAKFCNQENGEIQILLEALDNRLVLTVTDNGEGLTPEVQPYIFDKFTQFNDYKKGRAQGSGLGLSITWRIVRIHQGSIHVESEPGEGASFIVSLPLHPGAIPNMKPTAFLEYESLNEREKQE